MRDEAPIRALLAGDPAAVAHAISIVEAGGPAAVDLHRAVHPRTGGAHRLGITGPAGSGKSTLINQLVAPLRVHGESVAVLAIDPSSPMSGGALLGDRIRMSRAGADDGVFVRSMASRGSQGGLSRAAHDAADILDAAGFDYVLIETAGVGQSQLDIAGIAESVLVLGVPDAGDAIQAMKAGLVEIGDFFAVNKCDLPGSERAYGVIRCALDLRSRAEGEWIPRVFRTTATEGRGVAELAARIPEHRRHLEATGGLQERRQRRLRSHVRRIAEAMLVSDLWAGFGSGTLAASIEAVVAGDLAPFDLARSIVDGYRKP